MRLRKALSIGLILLILSGLLVTGCGGGDAEYDALLAEWEQAKQDYEAALQEQTQSEADVAAAEAELAELEKEYEVVKAENAAIEAAQAELDALKADLAKAQKEYDDISAQLDALVAQYTPRDFTSINELAAWLAQDTVSQQPAHTSLSGWLTKAQQIQTNALTDGYLININYFQHPSTGVYYVHCTTAINGKMYAWDPDNDDFFFDAGISGVE